MGAFGELRVQLRRWMEPPRKLRPTRAGWVFFVLLFGVGFAALNTGNNLLYLVFSFLLAFLTLSGVLSESALRGIEVRRQLPGELYAESEGRVLVDIHNSQRRVPAFAVVIEDLVSDTAQPDSSASLAGLGESGQPPTDARAAGRVFALRVAAGESEARLYRMHPARRGPLHYWGYRVSTRFPFGLFLKSRTIPARESSLVYPTLSPTTPYPPPPADTRDESGARPAGQAGGSQVTGLRDYAVGDPMRRVHWRSSLRRQALLVRELDDERDAEIEIRLATKGHAQDRRGPASTGAEPASSTDPFEAKVAWAASQAVAHLEQGLRVGLVTDREHVPAAAGRGQRRRLLSFLALVEPDPVGSPPLHAASTAAGEGGAES